MNKDREQINNKQEAEQKKLNVSLSLIREARNQKRTKALAVYYLLKSTYRNSCIYSYKSRMKDLAGSLGICEKTLYNYFAHLRRLGAIYEHRGNLILTSTKKLKNEAREHKKYQVTITGDETPQTIEARLMGKLIELQCKNIAFHRAVRKFENKRHLHRDSDIKTVNENDQITSISARNLQQLFQLSQSKTKKIVNILNDLGVIRTTTRNPQVMGYGVPKSSLRYSREFPGHFFIRDNFLFVRFGDYHQCMEYPVHVKELSYKQYLSNKKSGNCKKQYDIVKTTANFQHLKSLN